MSDTIGNDELFARLECLKLASGNTAKADKLIDWLLDQRKIGKCGCTGGDTPKTRSEILNRLFLVPSPNGKSEVSVREMCTAKHETIEYSAAYKDGALAALGLRSGMTAEEIHHWVMTGIIPGGEQ